MAQLQLDLFVVAICSPISNKIGVDMVSSPMDFRSVPARLWFHHDRPQAERQVPTHPRFQRKSALFTNLPLLVVGTANLFMRR